MSWLYIESFDFYGTGGWDVQYLIDTRWQWSGVPNGSPAWGVRTTSGRRGSAGLRICGGQAIQASYARLNLGGEHANLLLGFACKPLYTADVPDIPMFSFLNAALQEHFVIYRTAADGLEVYDKSGVGKVLLASSAASVCKPGSWQYWELKFTVDGTDSIEIRLDGVTVINQGGIDLQSAAGAVQVIDFRSYNGSGANGTMFDDMIILDTGGAVPNDFLGDVKVVGLLPDSDGVHADFYSTQATHHHAINVVGNNFAVDYNEGDAINEMETWGVTPDTYLDIHAVEVVTFGRDPQAGTNEFKHIARCGGTDYLGDAKILNDTNDRRSHVWTLNPDTGIAWTTADITNMELGVKVTNLA